MSLLIKVLIDTHTIKSFDNSEWRTIIDEGIKSNLIGRVYHSILKHKLKEHIPQEILWHFNAAHIVCERHQKDVLREIDELNKLLSHSNVETIFLKGAAYIASSLDCSYGRTQSDIDLMVNKNELHTAENCLFVGGYLKTKIESYDEHYYRTWMHEIPPLTHVNRNSVVDLHHNILPLTNKYNFDSRKLIKINVNHPWLGAISVLSPRDMIIHSSVHLFTESEYPKGLRDLSDLDLLIREECQNDESYNRLIARAKDLGLDEYVFLALRYSRQVFKTPVPFFVDNKHSKMKLKFLDYCFLQVFKPLTKSNLKWHSFLAHWLLYCRGHAHRMPIKLLAPHLLKKFFFNLKKSTERDKSENLIP